MRSSVASQGLEGIRAICLDLDDTLWEIASVVARAEERLHAFIAERYPRMSLVSGEALQARFREITAAFPERSHDYTFLRTELIRQTAVDAGYPETIAAEAFAVFFKARNEVSLYDDVLPGLECLARRYRLFSVTNGNADLQLIGLAPFFERSFAARDVGAMKPDPAMFRAVLEHTNLAPYEIAHVGDDPLADVACAHAQGMAAIWINRKGAHWPSELDPPQYSVSSLAELVAKLGCAAHG